MATRTRFLARGCHLDGRVRFRPDLVPENENTLAVMLTAVWFCQTPTTKAYKKRTHTHQQQLLLYKLSLCNKTTNNTQKQVADYSYSFVLDHHVGHDPSFVPLATLCDLCASQTLFGKHIWCHGGDVVTLYDDCLVIIISISIGLPRVSMAWSHGIQPNLTSRPGFGLYSRQDSNGTNRYHCHWFWIWGLFLCKLVGAVRTNGIVVGTTPRSDGRVHTYLSFGKLRMGYRYALRLQVVRRQDATTRSFVKFHDQEFARLYPLDGPVRSSTLSYRSSGCRECAREVLCSEWQ